MRSTLIINVTVDHPDDWNGYDIHDVLLFHLGLTDLNATEADVSAVKIIQSTFIDRTTHD